MKKTILSLACASLLGASAWAQAPSMVTYEVRIDATWSATTHPGAYPTNAHFSPPIGALHKNTSRLWENGGMATNGIEVMAETGATGPLTTEIQNLIAAGEAGSVLTSSPPATPGVRTFQFTVSEDFPMVSLVSMIAPSPDWFVGVDSLPLMQNGQWVDRIVTLPAWDAGTDMGMQFTSPDMDMVPSAPISLIQHGPFLVNNPLGTMTFTRIEIGTNYCGPAVPNSTGMSAQIDAFGSGMAGESLTLAADSMPTDQFGFFLVATGQGMMMPANSNGMLCLGTNMGRFNQTNEIRNSGMDGAFRLVVDPDVLPFTPTVAAQSGQTYHFQAWFRENGGTSNFTDGVSVTFQ